MFNDMVCPAGLMTERLCGPRPARRTVTPQKRALFRRDGHGVDAPYLKSVGLRRRAAGPEAGREFLRRL
jgi:hypothetical protein